MKKLLLVVGVFLISLFFFHSSAFATTLSWNEVQPAGDTDVNWASAKISMDGNVVVVGGRDGTSLYLSKDGGNTWMKQTPLGDDFENWYGLGLSKNGQVILAAVYGGPVYLTTDGGDTWVDALTTHDGSNWSTGSVSGDGQVMIAGASGGRLYVSSDRGASWSETQPGGNSDQQWNKTAINDNGYVMLAGVYGGRLYRSTNRGSTWTEVRPAGDSNLNWNAVSMDRDGKTMMVGIDQADTDPDVEPTGKIYLSRDGGNSWEHVNVDGSRGQEWRVLAMGEDGTNMLAGYGNGVGDGKLYLSLDKGSTWAETQPAGNTSNFWEAGAVSIDGYHFVAGVGNSSGTRRVYIGTLPSLSPIQTPGCASSQPGGIPDLFQIDTTRTKVKLYFTPISSNADKYVISFGYSSEDMRFGTELSGNSKGVMSYTINELSPNSTYYLRVRAGNGCATGGWSNTMAVKVGTTKTYYKSLLSQVISTILPQKSTSMNATTASSGGKCTTYTVQPGDSLWKIASQNLGTGSGYQAIMKSNNLNSSLIHTGQTLKVGC